jgi:hypothetical protein
MIEFIAPWCNLLQHFTNHYLRLDALDFWPQYTNPLLLEIEPLIVLQPRVWPHGKHVHCLVMDVSCCRVLLYALPSNGLFKGICLRRNIFIKPLPSKGSIRHNTYSYFVYFSQNFHSKIKVADRTPDLPSPPPAVPMSQYPVISSPLRLFLLPALPSQSPSVCVLLLMWKTKFDTRNTSSWYTFL